MQLKKNLGEHGNKVLIPVLGKATSPNDNGLPPRLLRRRHQKNAKSNQHDA
jgi:hypothetical protein